jgi:hypothetical protein
MYWIWSITMEKAVEKTIEDFIEQIFAENPKMTKDDMRKRLQSEKNLYHPSKQCWKYSTIRQRVDNFYKNKELKTQFSRDSEPSKESLKIEGMEIKKHPDIFKPEEVIKTTSKGILELCGLNEKRADDSLLSSFIQDDYAFKRELVSIIKDWKQEVTQSLSAMERDITSMKQEIPKIRQELKIPEPEVEYDFLEIKKPLIAEIKKKCEERNIDDESDYIDELIRFKDTWSQLDLENIDNIRMNNSKYATLIDIIKEAGGTAYLKIDYDDKTGLLGVEESSTGFGFRTKLLIVIGVAAAFLVGIGAGIGVASYFRLVNITLLPF